MFHPQCGLKGDTKRSNLHCLKTGLYFLCPVHWNDDNVQEKSSSQGFYHPALLATCCNVRLHLSGMGGGRIRGCGGWMDGGGGWGAGGVLRHILCPYMGMKFTRSGESSHWSWWMGRRAEGAAKVYIRRERGSRWCEIHSKQIPTEEQRRKEYL